MIKAVIFDFDGVIANTMADNCDSWQKALALHEVTIEPLEYYLLEGMGKYQIADFFIKKYDLDTMLRHTIASAKEEFYKQNNKFELYKGIQEIFKFLIDKGIRIGVVTGASRQRISNCLEESILGQFDFVITADDVQDSKPHPEPYLKAIERLGIDPSEGLVIENAQLGIQSAKSAGCNCFALETTLDRTYLSGADEVFNDHAELLFKLKSIFSN